MVCIEYREGTKNGHEEHFCDDCIHEEGKGYACEQKYCVSKCDYKKT